MAAGRPCIYVGDLRSDPARLLLEHGAGLAVRVGDAVGLADAIMRLKSNSEWRVEMGMNARRLLEDQFDFRIARQKWANLLSEVASME
jgi:glycosyltransferase involved in cell wall biosynthesis